MPGYRLLLASKELELRADRALRLLDACRVCPRCCGVDRSADEQKVCGIGRLARVASAFPHFGEEDCLRGRYGSGTIFFSGCNLGCVFCQNADISQEVRGTTLRAEELATLMLDLQARGCHNINLVTPEHVVPQVLEALVAAAAGGLTLPLVYNTSAYDGLDSLSLLDGIVDIYMPDFKVWDSDRAHRWLKARDYPEVARAAIREMHRQVGPLVLDDRGLARRGVLVRHLVMPGAEDDSRRILDWLADTLGSDTYVNVMGQYRPAWQVAQDAPRYADIARPPTAREVGAAREHARRRGLRLDGE